MAIVLAAVAVVPPMVRAETPPVVAMPHWSLSTIRLPTIEEPV